MLGWVEEIEKNQNHVQAHSIDRRGPKQKAEKNKEKKTADTKTSPATQDAYCAAATVRNREALTGSNTSYIS
jgi:hypothetical protein